MVTGSRAEFGLLESSMAAIQRDDKLELWTVATGMHLSPQHGTTVEEIEESGFTVDRTLHMLFDGDSGRSMAKSLGAGISGLAELLGEREPEIVLVLGDRDEALAAGVAAAHMNIPVAHIHGGDAMSGATIDDSNRHALTKFAHLHFPATDISAERIEKLGEEPWRITVVGAPGLDDVIAGSYHREEEVRRALELPEGEPLVLLVQHPLTTQSSRAATQMRTTFQALEAFDVQIIAIYPNADAGGKAMIQVIEEASEQENVHVFENLPRRYYLGLLGISDVMVGNSSSAIIEAPSFGLPAVDIGPRQEDREHTENVLSVPHDSDSIWDAVRRSLEDEQFRKRVSECVNPYDRGGAAEHIVDRLRSVELNDRLLQKQLTYEP